MAETESQRRDPEEALTISFKALQRSRTTIEDFVLSYFPYYNLQLTVDFFKHIDILVWIESYIYQIDEENECLARRGEFRTGHIDQGLRDITAVLSRRGLLTERLGQELEEGRKYWVSELRVCRKLLSQRIQPPPAPPPALPPGVKRSQAPAPLAGSRQCAPESPRTRRSGEGLIRGAASSYGAVDLPADSIGIKSISNSSNGEDNGGEGEGGGDEEWLSMEEVLAAHERKSFDYRALHLLLLALDRIPFDERLFEFLRLDEQLVDIGDDLVDYEDDVCDNSFNVFRGFVRVWGRDAEVKMMERIVALEREHAALLAALPAAARAHYWARHQEASRETGADRWAFPPPILDERRYRRQVEDAERGGPGTDF